MFDILEDGELVTRVETENAALCLMYTYQHYGYEAYINREEKYVNAYMREED